MNNEALTRSVSFVEGVDLPLPPRQKRSGGAPAPEAVLDDRQAALVVGSGIVSFEEGVAPELRSGIMNCSLIAQLAANKQVPDREDVRSWYSAYFDALTNIGWVIEARGFSEHHQASDLFEAHTAILSVASVLLGPATTAYALVAATLNSLKAMSEGPWLTIFRRESQAAKAAKFQVAVAEAGATGQAHLKMMAFELDAKSVLTQVLFVKLNSSDVVLRQASGAIAIDAGLLRRIAPRVEARVAAYQRSFVDALPI
jgi:hypothetical protein